MNVYHAPCSVLTAAQYRFLWLHARTSDPPFKWCWLFGMSALRAYTEGGHTATVPVEQLERLVAAGLVERGPGVADCIITKQGRAVL